MAAARFELSGFGGQLIHPGDAEYDDARQVFNGMIDRKPALIARCRTANDVVAAVNLAREQHLPISVYGGGHGVTGAAVCDAGVTVDLRGMKQIDVDPDQRVARAGGGATWGEFDAATQEHGLAVTGGRVSTTGIAGLALGSGSGWLERKFGFVCDNLLAGRGRHRRRTHRHRVRGRERGPVLGPARRRRQLRHRHPLRPAACTRSGRSCSAACSCTPRTWRRDLLPFYRDFMRRRAGRSRQRPRVHHRAARGVRARTGARPARHRHRVLLRRPGRRGRGRAAPLREFGPPGDRHGRADAVRRGAAAARCRGTRRACRTTGRPTSSTTCPTRRSTSSSSAATKPVSPLTQIILVPGGGAIARVDEDATAFGQRNAPWNIHYLSMWPDPADTEKNIAYTRELAGAMKPWTTGRAYLNFIGDEGTGRVEAALRAREVRAAAGSSRTSGTRRTCSATTRTSRRPPAPRVDRAHSTGEPNITRCPSGLSTLKSRIPYGWSSSGWTTFAPRPTSSA